MDSKTYAGAAPSTTDTSRSMYVAGDSKGSPSPPAATALRRSAPVVRQRRQAWAVRPQRMSRVRVVGDSQGSTRAWVRCGTPPSRNAEFRGSFAEKHQPSWSRMGVGAPRERRSSSAVRIGHTVMQLSANQSNLAIRVGDELTPPFRHARRVTPTPRSCRRCASFKGPFSVAPCRPRLVRTRTQNQHAGIE
jgi:hypothetical protein